MGMAESRHPNAPNRHAVFPASTIVIDEIVVIDEVHRWSDDDAHRKLAEIAAVAPPRCPRCGATHTPLVECSLRA